MKTHHHGAGKGASTTSMLLLLLCGLSISTVEAFFGSTGRLLSTITTTRSKHSSLLSMSTTQRPPTTTTTIVDEGKMHFSPKYPSTPPASKSTKRVWLFEEGRKEDKDILGGKGANLAEMVNMGMNVPPGFVISTKTCLEYFESSPDLPAGLVEEYMEAIRVVEAKTGKEFGNPANPLFFSVRSGAKISMPGMMDTVLSLGLNGETAEALVRQTGNPRWVYDTYRRFLQMYSNVVLGQDMEVFDHILSTYKKGKGYTEDTDMQADDWKFIVGEYKKVTSVPSDPHEQLEKAIKAVFQSWYLPRAMRYREYNDIPHDMGTAAVAQSMVFGNLGDTSGTGVLFSRNPSTGENKLFGEYLHNACGEDVVAGIRTPINLDTLQTTEPGLYQEIVEINNILENHYRDAMDVEFTVEDKKLYVLQCRSGKRTAKAAVKMAVDMVKEGLISKEEALMRVDAKMMDFFLHPTIDPNAVKEVVVKGLPASPGVGTGALVFSSDEAERLMKEGMDVLLVRKETTAEDIHGMKSSKGVLTQQGGMTSHAAVVARGMGKPCVSGCQEIEVDAEKQTVTLPSGKVLKKGDIVTIDGSTGEVMLGSVPLVRSASDADFQQILSWADEVRTLGVKANADTPEDAQKARALGAEGIGLCRTEHMFFSPEKIDVVRQMILADNKDERQQALDQLFIFQKEDMREIFSVMSGYPVTIRLLDPPLHEFLPHEPADIQALAKRINKDPHKVAHKIESLAETNPMLGLRGCRLGLLYPEISEMQVRAVVHAAAEAKQKGFDPQPEIMVPLVSIENELKVSMERAKATAEKVLKEELGGKVQLDYIKWGTMIELPRACLVAGQLAPYIDFASVGSNDMTQATFGFSRDDVGKFLPTYLESKILEKDPFQTLDRDGVGKLIDIAGTAIRAATKGTGKEIKLGICGEHGGDPKSIEFCVEKLKLDYTSCSPFRVPIARIAAAQSAIRAGEGKGMKGGGESSRWKKGERGRRDGRRREGEERG